jgi:hypothetical protein
MFIFFNIDVATTHRVCAEFGLLDFANLIRREGQPLRGGDLMSSDSRGAFMPILF